MFKVDPDALRAWAEWLDGLSADIKQLADDVTLGYGSSFPGTELGERLAETREAMKRALNSFSTRPARMSEIAHGAGNRYDLTDIDFAVGLEGMGGLS